MPTKGLNGVRHVPENTTFAGCYNIPQAIPKEQVLFQLQAIGIRQALYSGFAYNESSTYRWAGEYILVAAGAARGIFMSLGLPNEKFVQE